jgi:hypothetical protein
MLSNYELYKKERERSPLTKTQPYKPKYTQYKNTEFLEEPKIQYQSKIIPSSAKYSDLLPKAVLKTLENRTQILEDFERKCNLSKEKIESDVDNTLKEVIIIFEDYKQRLFSRIDEHKIGFSNLLEQLDLLSKDCTKFGEERLEEIERNNHLNQSVDETLYSQINEARMKRQKADEIEKALLAIKQKIEQNRLNDLNNDLNFLMDDKNPDIYVVSEGNDVNEKIKKALSDSLDRVDQSRLIRPFIMDKKVVKKAEPNFNLNREFEKKSFQIPNNSENIINTDLDKNRNTYTPQIPSQQKNPPIIAQQNMFISNQIDLSDPKIYLESEILIKNTSKITSIISLTNRIVLLGNNEGNFIIVDILPESPILKNQLLIKAHNAPIKIMNKTNDHLLMTTAEDPDYLIKIWDLSNLIEPDKKNTTTTDLNNSQNKTNIILLVSILKGHNAMVVGHAFLNGRIVISVDREGVVNLWDWKISNPISQLKLPINQINSFILFSDKECFSVANDKGIILSYSIIKSVNTYEFIKSSEIQENQQITGLQTFRGNNDLIITTLLSGETKLISRKSKMNLNTIIGCKSPLSFFIMTCVKNEPDVYLLASEPYGFKIADVDHPEFKYVDTNAQKNFRFECTGFPNWQILDCIPGEKVFFVTVNHATNPNSILLWSITGNK